MVKMIYKGIHPRELCLQTGKLLTVYADQEFEVSEKDSNSLKLQQYFEIKTDKAVK